MIRSIITMISTRISKLLGIKVGDFSLRNGRLFVFSLNCDFIAFYQIYYTFIIFMIIIISFINAIMKHNYASS